MFLVKKNINIFNLRSLFRLNKSEIENSLRNHNKWNKYYFFSITKKEFIVFTTYHSEISLSISNPTNPNEKKILQFYNNND